MSTIISNRDTALVNVLLMQSPLVIQINALYLQEILEVREVCELPWVPSTRSPDLGCVL